MDNNCLDETQFSFIAQRTLFYESARPARQDISEHCGDNRTSKYVVNASPPLPPPVMAAQC